MTLLGYYTKTTNRLLQDLDILNEQVSCVAIVTAVYM